MYIVLYYEKCRFAVCTDSRYRAEEQWFGNCCFITWTEWSKKQMMANESSLDRYPHTPKFFSAETFDRKQFSFVAKLTEQCSQHFIRRGRIRSHWYFNQDIAVISVKFEKACVVSHKDSYTLILRERPLDENLYIDVYFRNFRILNNRKI